MRALMPALPRLLALLAALIALSQAAPAADMNLEELKRKGFVGENRNGYVGIVHEPGAWEMRQFVNTLNAERREVYKSTAQRQGIPLQAVEALAAKQIYEKTPLGYYIRNEKGQWVRKQ